MKYYGLGRRKSAVAQVYISSFEKRSTKKFVQLARLASLAAGSPRLTSGPFSSQEPRPRASKGSMPIINDINISENIIINQKKFFDYFQNDQNLIQSIQEILKIFDQPLQIRVIVSGGGSTGQKDAKIGRAHV